MLLAAGALAALAFTALPSAASAGEFLNTCTTGAGATINVCEGTVIGGVAVLEEDSGSTIECTSVTGTATAIDNSTTGTVELTFHTCKDPTSGFSCSNTAKAGTITTQTMISHNVYLEHNASTPGVKLTGPAGGVNHNSSVTFSCAGGLVKKTVTGTILGEIEEPKCKTHQTTTKFVFAAKLPTGTQKWEQVTTTNAFTDLTSGTETSDTTTASQTGTGTITWKAGQNLTLDC
jgi:hypothetical protein